MAEMFCLSTASMQQLLDQSDQSEMIVVGTPVDQDDEEDVFQCGKCKQQFTCLSVFMEHKKHCPIKSHVIPTMSSSRGDQKHQPNNTITTLTRLVPAASSPSSHLMETVIEPPSASLGSNVITLSESEILSLTTGIGNGTVSVSGIPLNENSNPLGSESISILSDSGGTNGSTGHLVSGSGMDSVSQMFPLSFMTTNSLNNTTYLVTATSASTAGSPDADGDNITVSNDVVLNITTNCSNLLTDDCDMRRKSPHPDTNDTNTIKFSDEKKTSTSSSKLKCSFCDRAFSKNFDLQQHVRCHTGEKPFQCVVCGRAFAQKSNVKKHMQTHKVWPDGMAHTLSLSQEAANAAAETNGKNHEANEDRTSSAAASGEKPEYTCPYCRSSCKTYFELKTHMKNHKREKVYKCIQTTCGRMFSELDHFLEHIQVHEQDMTYRCHQCSKSFANLNDLANHQYSHSQVPSNGNSSQKSGQKYYRCQKCLNKYTTPAALEHHLTTSTHHYPCSQCSKVFPCERYLRRHLITHGSGLHECHYCDKTFKTANYLKVHLVIHTGVKPYVCNICPAAFNRRDKLKRHKLVHDPIKKYKCPFRSHTGCAKEFNRPDKLKAHMLTHSGVKPHSCSQCGRSFSRRAHLRAHFASHAAEKKQQQQNKQRQHQDSSMNQDGDEKNDSGEQVVQELDDAISMKTEGEIITLFDCVCGSLFVSEFDAKNHNCPQKLALQHQQHQQPEKQIATPPKKKASLIHAKNLEHEKNQRLAEHHSLMDDEDGDIRCDETGIMIDTSSRSSSGIPLNHLSPGGFSKLIH